MVKKKAKHSLSKREEERATSESWSNNNEQREGKCIDNPEENKDELFIPQKRHFLRCSKGEEENREDWFREP